MKPIRLWDTSDLNRILSDGDALCISTNVRNYPLVSELPSSFVMNGRQYSLNLENSCFSNLHFTNKDVNETPYMQFEDSVANIRNHGILTMGLGVPAYSVAIIKETHAYHIFDPHSRDDHGMLSASGKAVLSSLENVNDLKQFLNELCKSLSINSTYELTPLTLTSQTLDELQSNEIPILENHNHQISDCTDSSTSYDSDEMSLAAYSEILRNQNKLSNTIRCLRKSKHQAYINMHNIISEEYDSCIDFWDDSSADDEYIPKPKKKNASSKSGRPQLYRSISSVNNNDNDSTKEVIQDLLEDMVNQVVSKLNRKSTAQTALDSPKRNNEEKRGRKRKRDPALWKRNIQKRQRNSGKEYISQTGKVRAARKIGSTCSDKCRLKCFTKFSESQRENIFSDYWASGEKRDQKHFVLSHIEKAPVKRQTLQAKTKRSGSFKYFFYSENSRVQVCRLFFLNTVSIKQDFIYETFNQQVQPGVIRPSKSGKTNNKKLPDVVLQGIRNHINSYPRMESHYCRALTKKEYLAPDLSISEMYTQYLIYCKEHQIETAKEWAYRNVFNYEFNLGFFRPKKDQCSICLGHDNDPMPSAESENMYKIHLSNKVAARNIKSEAKAKAENRNEKSSTAAAFDMEQILLCPHGKSGTFYYRRRLGVYNLTVYDYKQGDVYCYMWPESEGRRGSNEVGTCLYNYAKTQHEKGIKELHLFSDNCGGQNRNHFIAFCLWWLRKKFDFKVIKHTFLEKGHTETENDSVHACIERKTRNISVYTPEQWYTAVRSTRKTKQPYFVQELENTMFIDFKSMSSKVLNMTLFDSGEKIYWTEVREVTVTSNDPVAILINTRFGCNPNRIDLFRNNRTRRSAENQSSDIELLFNLPKPGVSKDKKK